MGKYLVRQVASEPLFNMQKSIQLSIGFVCVFQEHSLMLHEGSIMKNKSVKLKISRRSKTFSKLFYNYN